MIPAINSATFAAVGSENRWRTNPVWCVERLADIWREKDSTWIDLPEKLARVIRCLQDHGIAIPIEAVHRWINRGWLAKPEAWSDFDVPPTPGVVGIIVEGSADAWVVPLHVTPARLWSIDPNLPFRTPNELPDLLIRVIKALGLPHGRAVPERFGFEVREPLLAEEEVLITDGPTPLAPGTMDLADLTQVSAFELTCKGNLLASLPLRPAPAANFNSEGGFKTPTDFTWSMAAEEELNDRLAHLFDNRGRRNHQ